MAALLLLHANPVMLVVMLQALKIRFVLTAIQVILVSVMVLPYAVHALWDSMHLQVVLVLAKCAQLVMCNRLLVNLVVLDAFQEGILIQKAWATVYLVRWVDLPLAQTTQCVLAVRQALTVLRRG
jgi:hypothetical protein